jgi:peroxiredoxin
MSSPYHDLPEGLPVPVDDGAADHLRGSVVPHLRLVSTLGGEVDLAEAAQNQVVVYVYPRTGKPGEPMPPGWDDIPGARGCTPQSCSFRDHVEELRAYGTGVIGISAQEPDDQREFAVREHIPYPLLSDSSLELADAMGLPVFEVAAIRLYRRLTFIARNGSVEKVFYPVFPPDRNVEEVLAWLARQAT